MTIVTQFDLHQEVWVVLKSTIESEIDRYRKPDSRAVHGFRINWRGEIIVQLEKYRGPFEFEYPEGEVFASKDLLLATHPDLIGVPETS